MRLPASKAAGAHLPLLGQGLLQVLNLRLRSLHFCLELLAGLWGRRRDIKVSLRARARLHDGDRAVNLLVQLVEKPSAALQGCSAGKEGLRGLFKAGDCSQLRG